MKNTIEFDRHFQTIYQSGKVWKLKLDDIGIFQSGIQGYTMFIDSNGDAEANYTVVVLKDDRKFLPLMRSMTEVGYFQPSKNNDGIGIPVCITIYIFGNGTPKFNGSHHITCKNILYLIVPMQSHMSELQLAEFS